MKKCSVIKTFFRSLLLQAVWNFERMQNVGFLYSILPCLKDIYKADKNQLKNSVLRHFEFFNTHPYIANTIMAIIISLENEKNIDDNLKSQHIKSLKLHLGGPLAAVGDTLFWARVRPLCALIAIACFFGKDESLTNFATPFPPCIPAVIFLVLYNILHIFFRTFGFWIGLKYKTGLVKIISSFKFDKVSKVLQIIGLVIGVFVLLRYLMLTEEYLLGLTVFGITFILIRNNISVTKVFCGLVIVSIILAYCQFL
ncbi:MAG: PTS system mannose/fructose/sorbose family transporter subunit IID [Elusimicrobiota bacterium]